ncbi:MAG TPA: hypothetical protein VHA76_09300 [Solirubrobacterales bacterium]|nr:hypothetical protein [Solirubrobacterales bacterium]
MPTPTDDLTLIKSFRAERDAEPPEARAAIWTALEARMEAATSEARAFGEAVAGAAPPAPPGARRARRSGDRREPSRCRRLGLAFAGAAVAAAIVAGALVLGSGPTAQRASAAEILHEAADAAAELPPTSVPGPGQYLFRKERRLDLEGWRHPLPPENADVPTSVIGGIAHGPDAFNALVPTTVSSWTGQDGAGRHREELGTLRFWSSEEEARWKAAGSPPPSGFDPEYQQRYKSSFGDAREVNSSVIDVEGKGWGNFHFPDTSKLPTEGKALRLATEANELEFTGFNHVARSATRLNAEQTLEELINVLMEGEPTPALQAAIFEALAELPGLEVSEATDGLGRQGEAIRLQPKEGFRAEYLFDPETGAMLAQRGVLVDPGATRGYAEIPTGTVVSERDFIEEATVDSTEETGQG